MQEGLKAVIGAADLDACSSRVNALTGLRCLRKGSSRMSVPVKWFTPAVKGHLDGIDDIYEMSPLGRGIESESNPSDGLSREGLRDEWTRQQGYSLAELPGYRFPVPRDAIFVWGSGAVTLG